MSLQRPQSHSDQTTPRSPVDREPLSPDSVADSVRIGDSKLSERKRADDMEASGLHEQQYSMVNNLSKLTGEKRKRSRFCIGGALKAGCVCYAYSDLSKGSLSQDGSSPGDRVLNISAAPSLLCSPSLIRPALAKGSSSKWVTFIDEVLKPIIAVLFFVLTV